MKPQLLYNLIEYHFDRVFCSWFQKKTHLTAVPKAVACSEKEKLESAGATSKFIKLEVKLNRDKNDNSDPVKRKPKPKKKQ